jgi:glycerol-3-phosphate dehydrogenase (NAD(P)+)
MTSGNHSASPIAVLGAGSWGTALAILLAKNGQTVRLWSHDPLHVADMQRLHSNERYLPGTPFPSTLQPVESLAATVDGLQDILIVVPSYAFASLLQQLKPLLRHDTRLVWATKGLTTDRQLLHQAATQVLGQEHASAVLSGPSFAKEVALGLPTAITLATTDATFARDLVGRFTNRHFRIYLSNDITGVEVCGVVKNVLAIAAGIVDGLQLGANALSALVTRGLVEMQRLGVALGGQPATFTGLAGLGDLVLSCTDNQSRNRRFGRAIASGKNVEQATQEIGQAIEGYYNIQAVHDLAQQLKIEMPITEQVYQVVYEHKPPQAAMQALLERQPKQEG